MVACRRQMEAVEGIVSIVLSWYENFVPEDSLQRIEINIGLLEEANLVVVATTILLVDAINKQNVLRREFEAAYFEAEERKGELDDIITLHIEPPVAADVFSRSVDVYLDAAGEVISGLCVLNDLSFVSCLGVVDGFGVLGRVLNVFSGMTSRQKEGCQGEYFQNVHILELDNGGDA